MPIPINYLSFYIRSSFLFVLFIVLFLSGCSKNPPNQQINNFIDINGDNKSDLIFWNNFDKDCFFETVLFPDLNFQSTKLGTKDDIPIYGDFTGDKSTDYGLYRYADGGSVWLLVDGLTGSNFNIRFGETGDIPVPGDFDGDRRTDFVVYRPRNSGFYGNLSVKNKVLEVHFGITGDIPVIKDYDGDNKADLAIYSPASSTWTIRSSKSDLTKQIKFGESGYLPIPNDYDGDGKSDLAVWNHKNNDCKIKFSLVGKKFPNELGLKIQEKLKDKICFPVSSDFDGDSKSELAFWEYDKNLLHVFNIKDKDFKYEQIEIKAAKGSEPINYFLLHRYLNKNYLINASTLYDEFKLSLLAKQKDLKTIPFNSATGKQVFGDFDGDGTDDIGLVDLSAKSFTYYSIGLNKLNNLALDKRIDGVPFAYDIDLDFISDLVFYNSETKIFGFLRSSENHRYDEVLYEGRK